MMTCQPSQIRNGVHVRYSQDHRSKTHDRILDEAARRFRADGIEATSLQPLMRSLGLTHGGFYAHFESKDDLVEAALRHAGEQMELATAKVLETDKPLHDFIYRYLSKAHRDNPGDGCALPTMSAELGKRGTPSATTDRIVLNRLTQIATQLSGDKADEQSILVLAALVGALQLSRSVQDPELSDKILKTTRRRLTSPQRILSSAYR
jgi:TetR/AcrR family transcriptional regulator, transcriptional repressor for nem operon